MFQRLSFSWLPNVAPAHCDGSGSLLLVQVSSLVTLLPSLQVPPLSRCPTSTSVAPTANPTNPQGATAAAWTGGKVDYPTLVPSGRSGPCFHVNSLTASFSSLASSTKNFHWISTAYCISFKVSPSDSKPCTPYVHLNTSQQEPMRAEFPSAHLPNEPHSDSFLFNTYFMFPD